MDSSSLFIMSVTTRFVALLSTSMMMLTRLIPMVSHLSNISYQLEHDICHCAMYYAIPGKLLRSIVFDVKCLCNGCVCVYMEMKHDNIHGLYCRDGCCFLKFGVTHETLEVNEAIMGGVTPLYRLSDFTDN